MESETRWSSGCYGYHDRFFNDGYWASGACWWGAAAVAVTSAIISPWWWWRPATYSSVATFYGPTYPPQPVVYDPGTTVIYEGDTIYINGKEAGDATEYRLQTIELASPPVETFPVPEPVEEGKPETWLPMGVWALTQQEQGDAVMFFQLSVDKNGIVAGAYKNILTNEDQPIIESQFLSHGKSVHSLHEASCSPFHSVSLRFGPRCLDGGHGAAWGVSTNGSGCGWLAHGVCLACVGAALCADRCGRGVSE
jgi:hypothetical protein